MSVSSAQAAANAVYHLDAVWSAEARRESFLESLDQNVSTLEQTLLAQNRKVDPEFFKILQGDIDALTTHYRQTSVSEESEKWNTLQEIQRRLLRLKTQQGAQRALTAPVDQQQVSSDTGQSPTISQLPPPSSGEITESSSPTPHTPPAQALVEGSASQAHTEDTTSEEEEHLLESGEFQAHADGATAEEEKSSRQRLLISSRSSQSYVDAAEQELLRQHHPTESQDAQHQNVQVIPEAASAVAERTDSGITVASNDTESAVARADELGASEPLGTPPVHSAKDLNALSDAHDDWFSSFEGGGDDEDYSMSPLELEGTPTSAQQSSPASLPPRPTFSSHAIQVDIPRPNIPPPVLVSCEADVPAAPPSPLRMDEVFITPRRRKPRRSLGAGVVKPLPIEVCLQGLKGRRTSAPRSCFLCESHPETPANRRKSAPPKAIPKKPKKRVSCPL